MPRLPEYSPGERRRLAESQAPPLAPQVDAAGRREPSELVRRIESELTTGTLSLPLLSAASAELLSACQRDDVDAGWLAQRVERDPAISAHVLRVANSAVSGAAEPVVSLAQAIARLGADMLRNLVLAGVLEAGVFKSRRAEPLMLELWLHSALAAGWAREIACARRRNVESSFLAGLMHDVGRAVLLSAASGLLGAQLDEAALAELAPFVEARHPQAGARLIRAWQLPAALASAVERHHAVDLTLDGDELALTIALADHFARTPGGAEPSEALRDLAAEMGFYPDEVAELLDRHARVEELATVFA